MHLRYPWSYGSLLGEWGESFIYARVNAFGPRAAFDSHVMKICAGDLLKKIFDKQDFLRLLLTRSSVSSNPPRASLHRLIWLISGPTLR